MTDGFAPPRQDAGCALIVGMEDYRKPGWSSLPGTAASAARFAAWLIEHEICTAERITLVTGTEPPGEHPARASAALPGVPINRIELHDARTDFEGWILGPHGPQPEDEFFYFFWAGHGVVYPDPDDKRVCLVTTDADAREITHLELIDLLDEVAKIAPEAYQVGFIGTCRDEVMSQQATALERGLRTVSAPPDKIPVTDLDFLEGYSAEERRPPERSIAFAASRGQSAMEAGFDDPTFPDYLLGALDGLDDGERPERLFGDFLTRFAEQLVAGEEEQQPVPEVIEYRYITHGPQRRFVSPSTLDDADLTRKEWTDLYQAAVAIDRAALEAEPSDGAALADDCWAAYCYAVGLEQALRITDAGVARATAIDGAADLVRALRDRAVPAAMPGRLPAPPLVWACWFLAGLPDPALAALATWCTSWGGDDDSPGGRKSRLKGVIYDRRNHRERYLGGECLSIMIYSVRFDVGKNKSDDGMECGIKATLATTGGEASVLLPRTVAGKKDEVINTVLRLLDSLEEAKVVPRFDDTLLEFVLPRKILARRPEYEGRTWLGPHRRVVIRDLEMIRDDARGMARKAAGGKLAAIGDHVAGQAWSKHIKWLDCEQWSIMEAADINGFVTDPDIYVLAITHAYRLEATIEEQWAPSAALGGSIDAGVPIIMSLHSMCIPCHLRATNVHTVHPEDSSCRVEKYKQFIEKAIDAHGRGPGELPLILKNIREKKESRGLEIGAVMFGDRPRSSYLTLTSAGDRSGN